MGFKPTQPGFGLYLMSSIPKHCITTTYGRHKEIEYIFSDVEEFQSSWGDVSKIYYMT